MQVIFKDFKKQTVSIEVELSDSVCIQTNKQKNIPDLHVNYFKEQLYSNNHISFIRYYQLKRN